MHSKVNDVITRTLFGVWTLCPYSDKGMLTHALKILYMSAYGLVKICQMRYMVVKSGTDDGIFHTKKLITRVPLKSSSGSDDGVPIQYVVKFRNRSALSFLSIRWMDHIFSFFPNLVLRYNSIKTVQYGTVIKSYRTKMKVRPQKCGIIYSYL